MKFLTTALDELPWVSHGFFTRLGGASDGIFNSLNCGFGTADDRRNVVSNRAAVAKQLGIKPENLVGLTQKHTTLAVPVTDPWDKNPDGDAMVTDRPGIGLGILTADCAPVLFADTQKKVIGAAHAGWRGAIGGILRNTVAEMEKLGADRANIVAAIGPCIGPDSYEVSAEFRKAFVENSPNNAVFFKNAEKLGHYIFDLPGFARSRLEGLGLAKVYDLQLDTLSNEDDFFSYRRKTLRGESDYGRQLSVIALKA